MTELEAIRNKIAQLDCSSPTRTEDKTMCLIEKIVSSYKPSRETLKVLNNELVQVFGSKSILDKISIRAPTNPFNQDLLHEGFTGIVYLNDLREKTLSFKYIFGVIDCTKDCDLQGYYLLEETISGPRLEDYLKKVPANEAGSKVVRSILLQLISALNSAWKVGVGNFSMDIRMRPGSPTVPVYSEKGVLNISTYGVIPVFYRFDNCSTVGYRSFGVVSPGPFRATIKSLREEQIEVYAFIRQNLSPQLAAMLPTNVDSVNFEDLIAAKYSIPESRVLIAVRSFIRRMDELVYILEHTPNPMVWSVLQKYAQILRVLAKDYPTLFSPSKPDTGGSQRSKLRMLDSKTLRSDLDFLSVVERIPKPPGSDDPNALSRGIAAGQKLLTDQARVKVDVGTPEGLYSSLYALRNAIRNQTYFETLSAFPCTICTEGIRQSNYLKNQLQIALASAPLPSVTNGRTALWLILYHEIVRPIDPARLLETQKIVSSENLARQAFLDSILASDPVPFFTSVT
jgi:hypothetical protein